MRREKLDLENINFDSSSSSIADDSSDLKKGGGFQSELVIGSKNKEASLLTRDLLD